MSRDYTRTIAEGSRSTFLVDVDHLFFDPKFDLRDDIGDISHLATRISNEGFLPEKPIPVRFRPDLKRYEAVDGRRRIRAAKLARDQMGGDGKVYVTLVSDVKNDHDLIFKTLGNQEDSKDFNDFERGAYYSMLVSLGQTPLQIASKISKSEVYVRDRIELSRAPLDQKIEAKRMISEGKISATAVKNLIKQGKNLKEIPVGPRGKISVQAVSKLVRGESAYISVKKCRETLALCRAMEEIKPEYALVCSVLENLMEGKTHVPN